MKISAIFALTLSVTAACSSSTDNTQTSPPPCPSCADGANGGASSSAGASAGTSSSVAGQTSFGGGGATSAAGSSSSVAGQASGGGAGAIAVAGAGGSAAGAGGAATGGATANGGSGGSVPVGDLPNLIPAGYTGKAFGGTPQQIPGKIEVEKYDTGGQGVAFNATAGAAFSKCGFMRTDAVALQCTGQAGPQDQDFATCANYPPGSVYIGYIGSGNYYKYTVDVLEAGTYVISGHEGVSGVTNVTFAFTDTEKTGNILLPSTNGKCTSEAYHVWGAQDNLGQITLTPGHYVMTLTVVNASLNMDWFAFTKQ